MTKLSISLVITAALVSTAACERNEVKREAEDVEDAREKVREEKSELHEEQRDEKQEVRKAQAELHEEQAELAIEIREQLTELERRYENLDGQATTVTKTLDITTGVGAEIQQARMLAKTKLEAAKNAKTPEETQRALNDAKDAIDRLEDELDDIKDEV